MSTKTTRREFLKRTAALSLLGRTAPFALQLAGISAAAAANQPRDYRALVCLFLLGGNDHYNTVIPTDPAGFEAYAQARREIALPRTALTPIKGHDFALHPSLAPLQSLFEDDKAALLANVGPLVVPIKDATQFKSTNVPRPPKLFSHNDQTAIWQALSPEGAKVGWGGKMCDLLAAHNGAPLFTAVSAFGNAVWLSSEKTIQYQIANSGAIGVNRLNANNLFGSAQGADALRAQLVASHDDLFQTEYSTVVGRSIDAHRILQSALAALPENDPRVALPAELAQDRLAQQLRIVSRMIGIRNDASMQQKRQVFYVGIGGFDTHDNQLEKQAELLASVGRSIAYFQRAMEQLGVAQNVTLFTGSDFGRTLTSNGDGSDHGWGAHHFIVGGAVKGGKAYGQFPESRLNTALDVGNGRLIPTTSVDQYAATLAKWMGVTDSDMRMVLPGIGNFGSPDVGFLA